MKAKDERRIMALPDAHITEDYDDTLLARFADRVKEWQPDEIIIMGDFVDLAAISKYTADKPGTWTPIQSEYDLAAEYIDIFKAKAKKAKITYIMGNHEDRAYHLVDRMPQLRGLVEPHVVMGLAKRGVKWIPADGSTYKTGPLSFTHGTFYGEGHAKKMATCYDTDLIYGHTHDVQSHTNTKYGPSHIAMSIGTLCNLEKSFMGKRPTNWVNAWGEFTIRGNEWTGGPVRLAS